MKVEVIECDRCGAQTRADSREAVSYTKMSVLKSGVCKEYDICPNDADAHRVWLEELKPQPPETTPVTA